MWVRMDDRWPYNRKIRSVEPLDRLMWAVSIAYASEQNTDGYLDPTMIEFVGVLAGVADTQAAAKRLLDACLWEQHDERVRVHDFLDFNPSKKERDAQKTAKAAAGQLGGLARARAQKPRSGTTSSRTQADAKQNASKPLAGNVPSSIEMTPSSSSRAPHVRRSSKAPKNTPTTTDDDDGAALDPRALAALEVVAEHLAATNGARNRAGYARAVRDDEERRTQLAGLATLHPGRDVDWLAREHLGQPHPPAPKPQCGNCRSTAHPTEECPIP